MISLTVRPSGNGQALTIRCPDPDLNGDAARIKLHAALGSIGSPSPSGSDPTELISIHHVSTEALTPLLESWTGIQALSQGWEAVMLPNSGERRIIRLPAGVELSLGLDRVDRKFLCKLHRFSPAMLADLRLEPDSCYLLFLSSELRGWIPVHRLNEQTIAFKSISKVFCMTMNYFPMNPAENP